MNIKSEQIRQVLALLGSPEMVNSSHEMAIRTFINEFPYVQPTYYLLAKATLHQDTHNDLKSLAATYCPNGEILYRTIFQPYKFPKDTYLEKFRTIKNEFENSNSPWSVLKYQTIVPTTPVTTDDNTLVADIQKEVEEETPNETLTELSSEQEFTSEQEIETQSTDNIQNEVEEETSNETLTELSSEEKFTSEEEIETTSTDNIQDKVEEETPNETLTELSSEGKFTSEKEIETPSTDIQNEVEETSNETLTELSSEEKFTSKQEIETPSTDIQNEVEEETSNETLTELSSEEKFTSEEEIETPSTDIQNEVEEETPNETLTELSSEEKFTSEEEIETPSTNIQNEVEEDIVVKNVIAAVEIETFDHPDSVYNAVFNDARFENNFEQSAEVQNIELQEEETQEEVVTSAEESTYTTIAQQVEMLKDLETSAPESQTNISKYDDDAMPYSFLWWLQKTRKDYYDNYQPFAKPIKEETTTNEIITTNIPEQKNLELLENQYKEHIFNLQTPFNIEDHLAESIMIPKKPKSSDIIDRFIKNEPQISAPVPNKLDNENKARVSTDESSELVTETLAKIYVEQMLYHKAIATYQKLSLKFPEKNRYFADLISQLEKKIN